MIDLKNIHIGTIIKEKMEERGVSAAELADKICCDRTTIYDVFQRKSINFDQLIMISDALDYDFVHKVYFPDMNKNYFSKKVLLAVEIDCELLKNTDLPKNVFRLLELPTKSVDYFHKNNLSKM